MTKIKSFLAFLVIWVIAITFIEYNGVWWLDILGNVVGGVMLLLWGYFDKES